MPWLKFDLVGKGGRRNDIIWLVTGDFHTSELVIKLLS